MYHRNCNDSHRNDEFVEAYVDPRTTSCRRPRGKKRFLLAIPILMVLLVLWRQENSTSSIEAAMDAASPSSSDAFEKAQATSRESTEATERAAAAAAELVDTLDAAREAADGLRRVAAAAAHKKRVADRAAAVAAYHARKVSVQPTDKLASVRERKVQLKDGSQASFSVFGRTDQDVSVFVLPYDTRRKTFTLIEEYHPGPDKKMVGLVAGMFEAKHGGSAEKAALWELSEEAQLKLGPHSQLLPLAPDAHTGEWLGFSQDKYSSAHFRPFLALDCEPDDRPRPMDREEDIRIHADISPSDLKAMIMRGELNIPSTAFAILGLQELEKQGLL